MKGETIELLLERAKQRGDTETPAEEVMLAFQLERPEAVKILQQASKQGLGEFIVGRGSNKTRIRWNRLRTNSSDTSVSASTSDPSRASTIPFIEHVLPLRADFDVRLRLPREFSPADAERIARFVRSLATDEATET